MRTYTIILLCFCICGCFKLRENSVQGDCCFESATGYDYCSYRILINSEPQGVEIEWDKKYIGKTPKEIVYSGHVDWSTELMVRAYPLFSGQFIQTKIIPGSSRIPKEIFFDMYYNPSPPVYDWILEDNACPNEGCF